MTKQVNKKTRLIEKIVVYRYDPRSSEGLLNVVLMIAAKLNELIDAVNKLKEK